MILFWVIKKLTIFYIKAKNELDDKNKNIFQEVQKVGPWRRKLKV